MPMVSPSNSFSAFSNAQGLRRLVAPYAAWNETTNVRYTAATALADALAAAVSGDVIVMGSTPGAAFDLGAFGIVVPANGKLIGQGFSSIIKSSTALGAGDGVVVTALGGAYLSDFLVYGTRRDVIYPPYQGIVGYHYGRKPSQVPGNVTVERVAMDGTSDCIYHNSGAKGAADASVWTYNDCHLLTRWDAVINIKTSGAPTASIIVNRGSIASTGNFGSPINPADGQPFTYFTDYVAGEGGTGEGSEVGQRLICGTLGTITLNDVILAAHMDSPDADLTPIVAINGTGTAVINANNCTLTTSSGTENTGHQIHVLSDVAHLGGAINLHNCNYDVAKVIDENGRINIV